ncbi:MAG: gamma-glutamyl-gamma-aminobutyrate hydrolase family protein [Deltaproteobacteria bacterium]|nr:MAG: gamma-glutamyl-gamma-aminobutyrate hydrolase family protein [Deltaproteobacteria bacterium]
MSNSPLIGLTSYGKKEANKYNLPAEYVDSVRRAGGIPVLLPPGETQIKSLCSRLDGIILSGGGDIHQDYYNGSAHPMIYNVDEQRDETEFKIIEVLLERNIPTLAICRGMQVLNIFLGGTLYEHLPETFGESVLHRLPPRETSKHLVDISPGSKLHRIVSTSQMEIVSWHHQAVKGIPKELTITAKSKDGVIEGLELDSHPWLVAVQWHPELSASEDRLQQQLFDALIEVSRRE